MKSLGFHQEVRGSRYYGLFLFKIKTILTINSPRGGDKYYFFFLISQSHFVDPFLPYFFAETFLDF